MPDAWIIAVGTELTLGQTIDTNTAWLAQRLAAFGIRTARHVTVADELAGVRDAILEAVDRSELAVITGGLGPTDDDLTRAALATAAHAPLELHPPSLDRIRAFFAARGREMPEPNRRQAMIPRGGAALENTCGTAPGILIELRGRRVFALPGVPFEMKTMFDRDVATHLAAVSGGRTIRSRTLYCFGLGEAQIGEMIADLMQRGRNPEVGTTANPGIIGIRINAAADHAAAADQMLAADEHMIRSRLGTHVFGAGDDTLAGVVGRRLRELGRTVCLAESCTGGLIAKLLTDTPGSSDYFVGGMVSYANQAKIAALGMDAELIARHGAVSEAVARAMAEAARSKFGSDYSLSVTGIAGPAGGTREKPVGLVYIALAGQDSSRSSHTEVRRLLLGDEAPRDVIRHRAAAGALDLLRRRLLAN